MAHEFREYEIGGDPVKIFDCTRGDWRRIHGILDGTRSKLVDKGALEAAETRISQLEAGLTDACNMISSEYCSHRGECEADKPECYISSFLSLLRGKNELAKDGE